MNGTRVSSSANAGMTQFRDNASRLVAASPVFLVLLAATIPLYPASGAFVSLSQATLMDRASERREQNMARWNFAGSIGVLLGPLFLSGFILLGLGWRWPFVCLAVITAGTVLLVARQSGAYANGDGDEGASAGFSAALRAVRYFALSGDTWTCS